MVTGRKTSPSPSGEPSVGSTRLTAVLTELVLPDEDERILDGNVAFTAGYLSRVLASVPDGCGIALLHSHLGPGWQDMSRDDDIAERDRLASRSRRPHRAAAGRADLGNRRHRGARGSGDAARHSPTKGSTLRPCGSSAQPSLL